nr:hypothetical protein [Mariniblastus fucicola]
MLKPRTTAIAIALLFAATALSFAQEIPKPAMHRMDGTIEWVYDYEKGQELSQESGKPMFVVFRCER